MKRLAIIAVIIACVFSFFLLYLDSQSEVGILNALSMEKENSNMDEKSSEVSQLDEQQNEQNEVSNKEDQPKDSVEATKEESSLEATPTATMEQPFVIVIDPGHQAKANLEKEPIGPGATETKYKVTGGTTGVATGKPEYVLTLEAAEMLKGHLENKGFEIILTRDSHDVDISNRERAEIANKHKADLFVRLHADGSDNSKTSGFSILVPGKDNPYTAEIYDESLKAAETILRHVSKEVPILHNGIFFRNDMSGFNWSKVPVILPEMGFMTNPEEDKKLSDEAYLSHLMELLALGIEEYVNSK